MREFIGVKSWLGTALYPSLKREALMFSRITIPQYKDLLDFLGLRRDSGEFYVSELEWLLERGVIFEPEQLRYDTKLWSNDTFNRYFDLEREEERQITAAILRAFEEAKTEMGDVDPETPIPPKYVADMVLKSLSGFYNASEYHARVVSVQLRELEEYEAYPILTKKIGDASDEELNKADIVEIVLNALPVPDDSTPWEQILDYRSDPNSQAKFLALRNWMNEVARSEQSLSEVEDKLEHLINEYRAHMQKHKMKIYPGTLQTLLVGTAETVENLMKLNLGKLANGLFFIKNRRIALMEAESAAPGREIAYIVKVRQEF